MRKDTWTAVHKAWLRQHGRDAADPNAATSAASLSGKPTVCMDWQLAALSHSDRRRHGLSCQVPASPETDGSYALVQTRCSLLSCSSTRHTSSGKVSVQPACTVWAAKHQQMPMHPSEAPSPSCCAAWQRSRQSSTGAACAAGHTHGSPLHIEREMSPV